MEKVENFFLGKIVKDDLVRYFKVKVDFGLKVHLENFDLEVVKKVSKETAVDQAVKIEIS